MTVVAMHRDCPLCESMRMRAQELVERAHDEALKAKEEREAVIQRLIAAERTIGGLKAEREREREDDPVSDQVRQVIVRWATLLGHPQIAKNANKSLASQPKRSERARWALKHFSLDDIYRAIEGCARKPYVGPQGRKETGRPHERHDDLELVLRDETKVRQFMAFSEEGDVIGWVPVFRQGTRLPDLGDMDMDLARRRVLTLSHFVRVYQEIAASDHECMLGLARRLDVLEGKGRQMRLEAA